MASNIPFTYGPDLPDNLPTVGFGSYFHSKFHRVPHAKLTRHRKFAAFVPLLSTYLLIEGFNSPLSAAPQHVFDLIPPHLIKAAAESRCVLVFDAGFEGDPLIQPAYENLHNWLDQHRIPPSNVLVINQNRVLEAHYRASMDRGVQFAIYDAYIKKTLSIFASDEPTFQAAVGFDRKSVAFRPAADAMKTFLCLNGAPRANRLVAVAALAKAGLLEDAEWSMLGDMAKKVTANFDEARTYRSQFGIDWISDDDIAQVLAKMPKLISIEEGKLDTINSSNELALGINRNLFDSTFCSIVTETEFTVGGVQRVTEKLLKPLVMGHPAVVIGNPRSLQIVRQFGFETFGALIDESYDECLGIAERLQLIIRALEQMQAGRRSGDPSFEGRLEKICAHNIGLAASGAAIRNYETVVEHPLADKLIEMVESLAPA